MPDGPEQNPAGHAPFYRLSKEFGATTAYAPNPLFASDRKEIQKIFRPLGAFFSAYQPAFPFRPRLYESVKVCFWEKAV